MSGVRRTQNARAEVSELASKDDAHLIAAAPELLVALKAAEKDLTDQAGQTNTPLLVHIRSAITKVGELMALLNSIRPHAAKCNCICCRAQALRSSIKAQNARR